MTLIPEGPWVCPKGPERSRQGTGVFYHQVVSGHSTSLEGATALDRSARWPLAEARKSWALKGKSISMDTIQSVRFL